MYNFRFHLRQISAGALFQDDNEIVLTYSKKKKIFMKYEIFIHKLVY